MDSSLSISATSAKACPWSGNCCLKSASSSSCKACNWMCKCANLPTWGRSLAKMLCREHQDKRMTSFSVFSLLGRSMQLLDIVVIGEISRATCLVASVL